MNYRNYFLTLLGTVFWLRTTAAAADSYCPFGWEARLGSNSCYKISAADSGDEYPDAKLRCQSEGGNLLVINDEAERDWVVLRFSQIGWYMSDNVWIGLKWDVSAEQWMWEDGTVLQQDLLPWDSLATVHPPSPYNASGTLSPDGFLGTAGPHMYYLPAICERSLTLPILCDVDDGWAQVSDVCIKSFRVPRTWDDARAACQGLGGDLISIGDDTNKFIHASSLQDPINNIWEHWVGLYETPTFVYAWVNGASEPGDHWGISEPQGHLGFGAAYISSVVYYTGVRMSETYPYICEKPQNYCIYGFEQLDSSCHANGITGATTGQNWDASELYCEEFGGHLVVIENAAENQYVAAGLSSRTWIGLYDAGDGSGFKWSDGRTLAQTGYTNWAVTPTPGLRRCAVLNSPAGTWELVDCNSNSDFSCETGAGATVDLQNLNHPPGNCPAGTWQRVGDYCYYYSTEILDWRAAEIWCESSNGELVNIMTEFEQNVTGTSNVDYWIGYNDRLTEGDWIWDHYKFNLPNMYDNWGKYEPRYDGLRNCAAMGLNETSTWYTDDCRNIKQFICKSSASVRKELPATTTTTVSGTNCDNGWDEDVLTGLCYRNLLNTKLTWYEAERECQLYNSHLLTVNNPEEQIFIESIMALYLESFPNFWLGAYLPQFTGWTWVDDNAFTFSNWIFDPTLYDDVNCAYLRRSDGIWWDESCDWRHNIICEKPGKVTVVTPTTPVPPSTSPGVCEASWEDSFTGCFLISSDELNWGSAEEYCISLGGHLASIQTQYEQDFLTETLANYENTTYWLGMSDKLYPMWFSWEDGSWPDVTPWGYQMPSYSDTQQQCVQISLTGYWSNIDCISESRYICRKAYALFEKVSAELEACDNYRVPSSPQAPNCGKPITNPSYGYSQYYLPNKGSCIKWEDAQEICNQCGGYVVSINDEKEKAFVDKLFGVNGYTFWIGLSYNFNTLEYTWESGEMVDYVAWDNHQPAPDSNSLCVATPTDDAKLYWSAVDCNKKYRVLCEVKDVSTTTAITTSTPPEECPENWQDDGEFCLLVVPQDLIYSAALSKCKTMNATLSSFHSLQEEKIATGNDISGQYWIGLEQPSKSGFSWMDKSPVNFVHWASDEPGTGNKRYTYWDFEDGWRLQNGDPDTHGYICKGIKGDIIPDDNLPTTPTKPPTTTQLHTTRSTTKQPTTTKKPTTTIKPTTTKKPTTTIKTSTSKPITTIKTSTSKPITTIKTTTSKPGSTSTAQSTTTRGGWIIPTGDNSSHGGAIAAGVILSCTFVTLICFIAYYIYHRNKYRRFGNSRENIVRDLQDGGNSEL